MFEKPRTLNTGYSEKTDNVNVYWGNTLHSLKSQLNVIYLNLEFTVINSICLDKLYA